MIKWVTVFRAVSLLSLGLAVGYGLGFWQGNFQQALKENKVSMANLRFFGTNLNPQLREYLKARIYCNVSAFYPAKAGYLLRSDWDFGSVDRAVLGPVSVCKDPASTAWDWASAIRGK